VTTKNLNIRVNQKGAKKAEYEQRKLGQSVGNTTNALKSLGGFLSAGLLVKMGLDMAKLAGEAEGVENAFKRLNKPGLLKELQASTRDTVSDFDLMKGAVRAENFDIPLKNLGKLMEFAQRRARDTGESVDFLVNSIVMGIGRKSPLILDNLGLNVVRVREEFKKTGDMAQAVANIADEELYKMGDYVETAADAGDRLTAAWTNLQIELGDKLNPSIIELSDNMTSLMKNFDVGTWSKIASVTSTITEYMFPAVEVLKDVPEIFSELTKQSPKVDFMALAIKNFGRETKDAGGSVEAFVETLSDGKTTLDSWTKKQKDSASDTEIVTKWQKRYNDELIKTYGLQTSLTDDFLAYRDEDIDRAGLDRTKGRNDNVIFDQKAYNEAMKYAKEWDEEVADIVESQKNRNQQLAQSLTQDLSKAWKSSFDEAGFHAEKFFQSLAEQIIENLILSAVSAIIQAILDYYTSGSSSSSGLGSAAATSVVDLISQKADGGSVYQSNPYIVGERGPELFIPSQSGQIVPNNQISNYGGNSTTINLHFQGVTDRKFVRDVVIPEIQRATRVQTI